MPASTTAHKAGDKVVARLTSSELKSGIAEIENVTAVKRWKDRGSPADDIEMEVPNIISNKANNVAYHRVYRRLRDKYGIDEREFVRQLLQRM